MPGWGFQFHLSHTYLEIARAATGPLPFRHPSGNLDAFIENHGPDPMANAILGVVSISVIYSYLSLEAIVNYWLFQLWEERHNGSHRSQRFLRLLGDVAPFEKYKTHASIKELGERIKSLCAILGIPKPHEAIPETWSRFKDLAEAFRHFLIHPVPDSRKFHETMKRMLEEQPSGVYVQVATELIGYMYERMGMPVPIWLSRSTLLRFGSVELLAGRSDDCSQGQSGADAGTQAT